MLTKNAMHGVSLRGRFKYYAGLPKPEHLLDECWEWQGQRSHAGYGLISVKGRKAAAHRVAWILLMGPIPYGMEVCHQCDNPPCVNPRHLFLGTHADNMHDSVVKGRAVQTPPYLPGEMGSGAKLTNAQVDEIRRIYRVGHVSQSKLAQTYGVSQSAISRAVNARTFKAGGSS